MKKNFLFGLLALMLAGFGFGGVSMAACTVTTTDSIATITVGADCDLVNAITTANANNNTAESLTIELPAGEHTLSKDSKFSKNITIKGPDKGENTDYTAIIKHDYNGGSAYQNKMGSDDVLLGELLNNNVSLTFENVRFELKGNVSGYGFKGGDNSKVTIKNSTVAGRLSTYTDMNFNHVDFVSHDNSYSTYNMDIHEGSEITFEGCTFEQKDRNINIYDYNNHSEDDHNVTFNNCTFKTTAKNKGAIVIHESHSKQGHAVKYKVTINNAKKEGQYPTNEEVIWRETPAKGEGYFTKIVAADGLVMIDDIRRVIATQGGEITVTVKDNNNTIYSYSTPKTEAVNVNADSKEELKAVINWYRSEGFCVGNLEGEELTAGSQELTITEATDDTAEAKIGDKKYCKLDDAIEFAEDGDVIEVLKANTYTLPAEIDKSITIEGKVDGVKFSHTVSSKSDQVISTISEDVTFSGITFVLNGEAAQRHFEQATDKKITMNDCIIDGTLHVRGNIEFNKCKFKKVEAQNANKYNLHINYGNVVFNDCEFTNNFPRNVNIAYGGDAEYNVEFNNTKFSYTSLDAPDKAAVMIHELRENVDYGHTAVPTTTIGGKNCVKGLWTVSFDSKSEVLSTYSSALLGNSQLFGIDDAYAEDGIKVDPSSTDKSYGTAEGGNVKVKINGTIVYSTPKRDESGLIKHNVTFDGANAVEVEDGSKVDKPTDPTKSCNKFNGWYLLDKEYDFNNVVTSDLALVSKWTYTCSSSSGGGGSSRKTETKADDAKATTGDTAKLDEQKSDESKADEAKTSEEAKAAADAQALKDGYSQEFIDAYNFARKNNITTKDTIREADMDAPLTRIAMAKMLSQYAINVLGKTPDTSIEVPTFPDVDAKLDADYNNGVTLAYQLGIMGINVNKYRPFDLVTRAEFGTALSRMLFGLEDGEGNEWYSTHLAKLMEEQIITNNNPNLQELRGYVMIMLMRSAQ